MANEWENYPYHATSEQVVNILRTHTQNTRSDTYFRVLTSFFFAQMAASMRTMIETKDRGRIPVNAYVCALMESGAGKGHSLNIMEDNIVNQFKDRFVKETFPNVAEQTIQDAAMVASVRKNTQYDAELDKLSKEYGNLGAMPYSFSEGTGPAYKQVRGKAQIASIGSLNFIMDEIGSNLLTAQELLTVCLETYDVGKVKDKITKSSSDNIRQEARTDPVPSNMLVFGTPAKVFNGGKEENEFISLQETGYARRFLFGFGNKGSDRVYTAEELYDLLSQNSTALASGSLSDRFYTLADASQHNRVILMERTESIALIQYKLDCEKEADTFPEHDHIRKAELQHRYFKALKLAGAYAFIDSTYNVTLEQLYAAIKVVEDSGEAFKQIMARPKPYERLAKYISTVGIEVTHADLTEALPFYRGANGVKAEMLQLAQAWGHGKNIIIRRYFKSGIEFLKGESLKENDLKEIILSYSNQLADNYLPKRIPFSRIHELTQKSGLHWANHHFLDNHRAEVDAIPEFNTVILDVDGGVSLQTAMLVLQDYTAHYYTTKRHQVLEGDIQHGDRFRIILPLKYTLKQDAEDFKEFMTNIYESLPFKVDTCTGQRSKKWETYAGTHTYTEGILLDPMPYIPKTSINEERQRSIKALGNLDSAERWFAARMVNGNRNDSLNKFALMLKDSGMLYAEVEQRVTEFNGKLDDPLSAVELNTTILKSIATKYAKEV